MLEEIPALRSGVITQVIAPGVSRGILRVRNDWRIASHVCTATLERMQSVQIFGLKSSQATRAAERFFKERRADIHFVDLKQKPMSPGEIKRFIDKFGMLALLETEGSAYADAGLKYLKIADSELLGRIEREPKLLRLPLVRSANKFSVGHDEAAWKAMLAAPAR